MTAFVKADLPADVLTVEQVFAWSLSVLEFNLGSLSYPETIAGNEYYVSNKTGRALDGTLRRIGRVSLELTADYQTRPIWKAVKELNTGTIPAAFKIAE
jgi:hypothetical protein